MKSNYRRVMWLSLDPRRMPKSHCQCNAVVFHKRAEQPSRSYCAILHEIGLRSRLKHDPAIFRIKRTWSAVGGLRIVLGRNMWSRRLYICCGYSFPAPALHR